jgi:hypothetical protein
MSHDKWFYCEGKGSSLSVDHHIEVAERRDLAFEWTNLYLACDVCQKKIPNTSIPAADCVDPCDAAAEPSQHITFESAGATFKSPRGEATVRKYRLNHLAQIAERRRHLLFFHDALERFRRRQIADGRAALLAEELAELVRFARSDQPSRSCSATTCAAGASPRPRRRRSSRRLAIKPGARTCARAGRPLL